MGKSVSLFSPFLDIDLFGWALINQDSKNP
jgi:hypothetical protein